MLNTIYNRAVLLYCVVHFVGDSAGAKEGRSSQPLEVLQGNRVPVELTHFLIFNIELHCYVIVRAIFI